MANSPSTKTKLLCVDDEPLVLEGIALHVRRGYALSTATAGEAGLEVMRRQGPFAIVVSDMRMPGMNGAEFLAKARELAPDTVRLLLTGQSDLASAISAVNEGQIFRFLSKPCPPDVLLSTLVAATKHYELVTAERILLEQTLHGSIKMLTDVLSLANPVAFGRGSRSKEYVARLMVDTGRSPDWQCDVAAMLSQIGCVTLPPDTLSRLYEGQSLEGEEAAMVARLPGVAERLVSHIPRMEGVRAILAHMEDHFEPAKSAQTVRGESLPWGSRALKIVLDYLTLEVQLGSSSASLDTMRGRKGVYDPAILKAFASMLGSSGPEAEVRQVTVRELRQGMVLRENVVTRSGMLLMSKGHEVSSGLLERILNFSRGVGVREPISVVIGSVRPPPR